MEGAHWFSEESFGKITKCSVCRKVVGFMKQGFRCEKCKIVVHGACRTTAHAELPCHHTQPRPPPPPPPPRTVAPHQEHHESGLAGIKLEDRTSNGGEQRETDRANVVTSEEDHEQETENDLAKPIVDDHHQGSGGEDEDKSSWAIVEEEVLPMQTTEVRSASFGTDANAVDIEDQQVLLNEEKERTAMAEAAKALEQSAIGLPIEEEEDESEEDLEEDLEPDEFFDGHPTCEEPPSEEIEPFGSVSVRIVDVYSVDNDPNSSGKRLNLNIPKAAAFSIGFGSSKESLLLPLDKDERNLDQSEIQGKISNALSSIRNQTVGGPSQSLAQWDMDQSFSFPIHEILSDVRVVIFKTKFMTQQRKAVGHVIVPLFSILAESDQILDGWFEFFPIQSQQNAKFRPATPTVNKSGMDFPTRSIGYVHLQCQVKLNMPLDKLWQKYFAKPDFAVLSGKSKKSKRGSIRGALDSMKEIQRNFLRIKLARTFISSNVLTAPLQLSERARSWEDPLFSSMCLLFWWYFVLYASLWHFPLLLYGLFYIVTNSEMLSARLQMNWKAVPIPVINRRKSSSESGEPNSPIDKDNQPSLTSNEKSTSSTTERGKHGSLLQAGRSRAFNAMKEKIGKVGTMMPKIKKQLDRSGNQDVSQVSNSNDDVLLCTNSIYSTRLEDSYFFPREQHILQLDDFVIWNEHTRSSQKGLNFLEKSASASREVRWAEEFTSWMADQLERVVFVLTSGDEQASFAMSVVLLCASLLTAGVLFLASRFPGSARLIALLGGVLYISPPAIREIISLQIKLSATPTTASANQSHSSSKLWLMISSLWERIPTIDEIGHRQIASHQRVIPGPWATSVQGAGRSRDNVINTSGIDAASRAKKSILRQKMWS